MPITGRLTLFRKLIQYEKFFLILFYKRGKKVYSYFSLPSGTKYKNYSKKKGHIWEFWCKLFIDGMGNSLTHILT